MPIQRTSEPLVALQRYVSTVALVPPEPYVPGTPGARGARPPWPTAVPRWAFIPVFQRGIDWTRADVEALALSMSDVLGTTFWGQFDFQVAPFPVATAPAGTPNLNYPPTTAIHLTDGLQRFAIGTSILNALDGIGVFGTGAVAANLPRLSAGTSQIDREIMRFNHHVLLNYPRPAVAQGYVDFFDDIEQWVQSSCTDPGWLSSIERLLLDRHIGVDIYGGFATSADLASNFVGLNTGGQQLGVVDILRAKIVAEGQQSGWTTVEALQYDTDLAQTLSMNELVGRIDPLVTQMGKVAQSRALAVLPALGANNGSALKTQTTELLERIDAFSSPSSGPALVLGADNRVAEIQACGKLPFSILAAYHLRELTSPWFLGSPPKAPSDELLVLLRANYRLYFAGVEGRQTSLLVRLLDGSFSPGSLINLADGLSRQATSSIVDGGIGIETPIDAGVMSFWLEAVPKRRAARVFSACELPPSFAPGGALIIPRPTTFSQQTFGQRNADLQVDHLIPQSTGGTPDPNEETLRNFAPIPTHLNRAVSSRNCDEKLVGTGGANSGPPLYGPLVAGTYMPGTGAAGPSVPHPYVVWLVQSHAAAVAAHDLNDKAKLSDRSVGDARMQWLVDRLVQRV